ncbi:hypothetical protein K8I61_02570, partial [bacterium]|nr:hypothetical protein [bacterium]
SSSAWASSAWSRLMPAAAAAVASAALFRLLNFVAFEGQATREIWAPALYAIAATGMIAAALFALGGRSARVRDAFAALSIGFQILAVGCAALRAPGHALAAGELMLAVHAPAAVLLALAGGTHRLASGARLLSRFVIAGLPPLPGFIARLDAAGALVHADLVWMAIYMAVAQTVVFASLMRTFFDDPRR